MRTTIPDHVAPVLVRLGRGSAISSVFVAACLIVQMLVFGFVHFTDARFEPAPVAETPPRVVTAKTPEANPEPAPLVPRVPSRWDSVMRNFASTGAWVGTVACLMLMAQFTLAVAVTASTAAPGVDRIVSAFHWGLLVTLVSLPLHMIIPAFPTIGVFVGYDTMAAASERAVANGGDPMLIVSLVVVPFLALFALILAHARIRQGIHAGVLVQSVSQFDQRIEEEIARVRAEGVGSNIGPRAIGVVGAPVGLAPTTPDPQGSATLRREIDDLVRGGRRPI
ncbi:MAG: hypothetical protein HEQ23_03450 [Tepidisphaera sp.]